MQVVDEVHATDRKYVKMSDGSLRVDGYGPFGSDVYEKYREKQSRATRQRLLEKLLEEAQNRAEQVSPAGVHRDETADEEAEEVPVLTEDEIIQGLNDLGPLEG